MEYKGTGLEGEILIDNSNGKFTSTNLDEILQEIYTARASGGGTAQSDEWIVHHSSVFSTIGWYDLPTNWTDLRFVFIEEGSGTQLYYDYFQDFTKIELEELVALGYEDATWYIHAILVDYSQDNLDLGIDITGNRYYVSSPDSNNTLIVFYKNLA